MSITPASPLDRTPIESWKLDAAGLRIYERTVVLVYGGYDASGRRIDERRFDLSDTSTPTIASFLVACPAAPTFKRQVEQFGVTLDPVLSGNVS